MPGDGGTTRTWRRWVVARVRLAVDGLERLVGGLGTAVLALAVLLWLLVSTVTCVVGVGFFLLPTALRAVRAVADRERARLSRWGPELVAPGPVPARLGSALRSRTGPCGARSGGWCATRCPGSRSGWSR